MKAKPPQTPKKLQKFLGQINWHNGHVGFLAHNTSPLFAMCNVALKKFFQTPKVDIAFRRLKLLLSNAPRLIPPDWTKPFHVFVNASNLAKDAVLMQETNEGWYRPNLYASKKLSYREKKWSTTKKELVAMVFATRKFAHYFLGEPFIFLVDTQCSLLYSYWNSLTE